MERQGLANWWAPASERTAVSKTKQNMKSHGGRQHPLLNIRVYTCIHQRERRRKKEKKKKIFQNKPKDERLYWNVQNTKKTWRNSERQPMVMNWQELHIIVNDLGFFLKAICKLNAIHINIPVTFFIKIKQNALKF